MQKSHRLEIGDSWLQRKIDGLGGHKINDIKFQTMLITKFWRFKILGEAGEELGLPFACRSYVPNSQLSLIEKKKFKNQLHEFNPGIQKVVLTDNSILADFIYGEIEVGGRGMILSEKAYCTLKKYSMPEHKIYDLEIVFKKEKVEKKYYWMHMINFDRINEIDFNNSDIRLKEGDLLVDNAKNLVKYVSVFERRDINLKSVDFNNPDNLDLFEIRGVGFFHWIGNSLKEALLENKLTGLYPITSATPYQSWDSRADN